MVRRILTAHAGCLLALLAACQMPPQPPPPAEPTFEPEVLFALRAFTGPLLAGPLPGMNIDVPAEPEQALSLNCEVLFVETLPEEGLTPVVSAARLVMASPAERFLLPTVQLARGTSAGSGPRAEAVLEDLHAGAYGQFERSAGILGALPPGVTAVFHLDREKDTLEQGPRPIRTGVSLFVSRSAEKLDAPLELGIGVSGQLEVPVDPPLETLMAAEGPVPPEFESVMRYEFVVLDARLPQHGGPVVVALPSPFLTGTASAVVLSLDVGLAPGADERGGAVHPSLVKGCLAGLERVSQLADLSSSTLQPDERTWLEWLTAHQSLDDRGLRRPALTSLAGLCDAQLAGDLVLLADEEFLELFSGLLLEQGLETPTQPYELGPVAWALERTAFTLLATEEAESRLARDLAVLLPLHAGELGHYPGTIVDLAATSPDLPTFLEQLVQENLIFLEDPNPSARVRSFDWLAARGRQPEGYDPLGPSIERRAALMRFEEELERNTRESAGNEVEGEQP